MKADRVDGQTLTSMFVHRVAFHYQRQINYLFPETAGMTHIDHSLFSCSCCLTRTHVLQLHIFTVSQEMKTVFQQLSYWCPQRHPYNLGECVTPPLLFTLSPKMVP